MSVTEARRKQCTTVKDVNRITLFRGTAIKNENKQPVSHPTPNLEKGSQTGAERLQQVLMLLIKSDKWSDIHS